MIKILKASAGSGKTYNLALEYIRLLLLSPERFKYRSILAVTFTNKATDEMKRRILKELFILSTKPEESDYYSVFVPESFPDAESLRKKADRCLCSILHDYSAFAVSTIDRFFQQTLRAFSREIGQFSSYQVELDREGLVEESVDRILDSLTEDDKGMLAWLTDSVMAGLGMGNRFSLEKDLKKIAGSLKSEDHQAMVERYRIDEEKDYSMERLKEVRAVCTGIIDAFEKEVPLRAQAVLDVFSAEGIDPEETNGKYLKGLYKYAELSPGDPVDKPSSSFLTKSADSNKWFAKGKDKFRLALEGKLEEPLRAFCALFDLPFKEYETALLIRKQLYGLGIAGALRKAFADLQREKNILSIDDSNQILRNIIDGSDAPFVYEKLGVRFEDFLLDEFQDTSAVQWENFRPLLKNSEAGGFGNLVVGDVKQSIYRWRGSDWHLLDSGLQKEFRDSYPDELRSNYRTLGEIVRFNNRFFPFAARALDSLLGEEHRIEDLYADVRQEVKISRTEEGSVGLVFVPDKESEIGEILASVDRLLSEGAGPGDIAILVRSNTDGSRIASELIAHGLPVISDDSLFVKSSVIVRRLVSELSLVEAPLAGNERSVRGYLARTLGVHVPESYHSLTDLAESLLRDLIRSDAAAVEGEAAYIHAFMDLLQDWSTANGNHLSAFLKYWEGENPKLASPQQGASIRVMTVHKSKGLEFPYVIFPYAEEVELFRASESWCRPETAGTRLSGAADGIYPVNLSAGSENTLFAEDYRRERELQFIDNLNVFYVAMTRAKYGLEVIAERPSKAVRDALSKKAAQIPYSNLSHVLYGFAVSGDSGMVRKEEESGALRFLKGTRFDCSVREEKPSVTGRIPLGYPSFPLNPEGTGSRGRLRYSPEAADFFGPGGEVGKDASPRIRGLVMHRILSEVAVAEDLPGAVSRAVSRGELFREEAPRILSLLSEKIHAAPSEWFPEDRSRLLNETTVFDPAWRGRGGRGQFENRPDRVILDGDGVIVVDYKFGAEEPEYRTQVRRYMTLFREMGYGTVHGWLWYIRENGSDFFEEVSL